MNRRRQLGRLALAAMFLLLTAGCGNSTDADAQRLADLIDEPTSEKTDWESRDKKIEELVSKLRAHVAKMSAKQKLRFMDEWQDKLDTYLLDVLEEEIQKMTNQLK